ncbi:DUF2303 family protein [Agarivorans sp. B2Z047]|uniref:DUF2303 family protein n=1 Tax=Agarivorans sp. B2Z047 TaxID=2652721 RepID=UPI00128C1072|nr:DUF2303 family protein [Agarivorans sp. B2Z047]MPW31842.1 DUF2303 family protein [Agarivorans sp. B2Z047]UQN41918.1 YfdQ family protein [Agarivorans sp. B2Z047]
MDKSAVQQIQESANIPAIIEQVSNAGATVPSVVIPDSMSITSIENKMEFAARYRQSYNTPSITDYVSYSKKFDQDGAICFIDPDRMFAKTIFDLGTDVKPKHKEHTGKLTLKKSAAFAALLEKDGEKLQQKSAGEFLEDWSDCIRVFSKSGDPMNSALAVLSLQNLTIESAREVNSKVDDFGEQMSAMERIEAKNQDEIPAAIKFTCTPYQGLSERTFEMRVGILTGSDKPVVVFRILRLEAEMELISDEFKGILVEEFKDQTLETYIGTCG